MAMRQLLPQTETFPYLGVLAQNTDLNNAPNGVCVIGGKYGNAPATGSGNNYGTLYSIRTSSICAQLLVNTEGMLRVRSAGLANGRLTWSAWKLVTAS